VSWRLEINHVTRYDYDRPVVASYNEARVTPLTTPTQMVIDARVAVRPPAEVFAYWDYWGTLVHAFDVHDPHRSLTVTAKALVDTGVNEAVGLPRQPGLAGTANEATWAELESPAIEDLYYEFLAPSRYIAPSELGKVAAELSRGCATPAEAVPAVVDWAHGQLEYGPGSTHVHTSAVEAWRAGRGVCQDFTHLSLAVLRAMRIPARYVSGYFYPKAAGEPGLKVLGESHAWVEAWTGAWSSYDPTNRVPVGERHVVVARGRDYADVSPLRGIYSGPPGSSTDVTVELTRRK